MTEEMQTFAANVLNNGAIGSFRGHIASDYYFGGG